MFGSAKNEAHSSERDEDLSTILTSEERVELTLLISNIAEHMRKQITDNFEIITTSTRPPDQALNITDRNPNIKQDDVQEQTEEQKKAAELQEQREKELSAPEMQELKKECLMHFDGWRESVISRVGNVVNTPTKVTTEQKAQATAESTPAPEIDAKPQVIGVQSPVEDLLLANVCARLQLECRRSRRCPHQAVSSHIDYPVFPPTGQANSATELHASAPPFTRTLRRTISNSTTAYRILVSSATTCALQE